jgi:hypothetical protein
MYRKNSGPPTPEQAAKIDRQRLAREDGARAMEDAARQQAGVHKNMARLRELRLARDAEQPPAVAVKAKPKRTKL